MSARTVAYALFRQRRLMAAVVLAVLAAGAALAAWMPVRWRAEATLLVEADRPEAAAALAALLESRDLHRLVVARHGKHLYPRLAEGERADAFARDLAVAADRAVVRLALDGADPAVTAAALADLIEAMRARNHAVFVPAADSDGTAAREAAAARERLAAFRQRHGVVDPAAERDALLRQRASLDAETAAAEAEAQAAAERLTVLKGRLAATPPTIALATESERSKVAEDARAKLFELETREAELLGRYQDTSVFVRNLRAEKRKVEALLAELQTATPSRVTSGRNPVHQDLETEANRTEAALSAARARVKAGQRQRAELDRRLGALAGIERTLAELEAAVAQAEARAGSVAHGPAVAGIGIVQQASAAARPLGPGRPLVLGAAFLGGLVLAVLAAALAQRLSSRFATPADVERRLGLPVLTTIPRES